MSRKAVVLSSEGGLVSVLPVSKPECASCTASCGRKEDAVYVANPKGFPVNVGDVVYIAANRRWQALEGLVSLLFPFLSAVVGYFAAGFLAVRCNRIPSDGMRAVFVLAFLFSASAVVLLCTRVLRLGGRVEIVGAGGMDPDGRSVR
ncbi:MAG: SoxR reducing system RseC family protein [Treponema sp.]|nr:SoxR reducing system RseC family protein [Treponema sp.]MCR5621180.1 SoxR reducing system RseC family protein [Treponema sp.]